MDITPTNTHQSTGAGRGIVKMDGTGKLSNKIALITGGTTGIGAAAATRFQAESARVIVTGSNPATLQVARENMPGIEVIASDAGDVAATKMLIEGKDRRTRIAERHECVTYRVVMHVLSYAGYVTALSSRLRF